MRFPLHLTIHCTRAAFKQNRQHAINISMKFSLKKENALRSIYWARKKFFEQSIYLIHFFSTSNTSNKIPIWLKFVCFFSVSVEVHPLSNRSAKCWDGRVGYEHQYRRPNTDEYPFRTFRTGTNAGFNVILKILHENIDKLCDGALNGFRVTFHTPYEFPYFTKLQYYISSKRAVDFLITPKVILPSTGLHTYDPIERQCYFEHERRLEFFKIYTQGNCQLECAWNVTIKECDCFTLTMPSK